MRELYSSVHGARERDPSALANHRHQRHDARAARDEQQRIGGRGIPHEVATDRAAHLEAIAQDELVVQERRDLAVDDALDGQLDQRAGRVGGDAIE